MPTTTASDNTIIFDDFLMSPQEPRVVLTPIVLYHLLFLFTSPIQKAQLNLNKIKNI